MAVVAELAGGVHGCLLGGGVLISGHVRKLPENKECRHSQALTAGYELCSPHAH